ncbi:MAG TPA: hypothetical protein VHU86_11390 [Solirubrobacterales bacterium]|jgi:hypothetical protein|nr:hypothetical protein [Solirubrobacterales bacterium]
MEVSSGKSRHRIWIAVAALGATLALAATVNAAEAPTRTEYVSQLEGVCKPDAEATQRAMKGARSDISAERLAIAAAKFAKATTIFGSTVKKISAVPQPPADAAKLGKWFGYLTNQESYLKQITAQLRAGHSIQAQRLTARFIHNGNLANNVVLAFGFDYCSFKFSRYG